MLAPDGGSVDDAARLFVQHVRQHGADGVARAVQVDGKVALPHLVRHVLEQRLPGHARVVHQQRHRAESLLHAAHHGLHRRAVGHVRLHGHRRAARLRQLGEQLLRLVAALQVVDADGVPVPRQPPRHGAADAAGGACHQCDPIHKPILPALNSPALYHVRVKKESPFYCRVPAISPTRSARLWRIGRQDRTGCSAAMACSGSQEAIKSGKSSTLLIMPRPR